VRTSGRAADWSLVLRGVPAAAAVRGGRAEPGAEGVRIVPDAGAAELEIRL